MNDPLTCVYTSRPYLNYPSFFLFRTEMLIQSSKRFISELVQVEAFRSLRSVILEGESLCWGMQAK